MPRENACHDSLYVVALSFPSMTDPNKALLKTPLYRFHSENGARFVDFGGWEMPVQYTSILDEHKAVRSAAGLFDVSHMGEIVVTGHGAEFFLDRLLTNRIENLPSGKAIYSPMCHPDGGAVDDLIAYRRGPDDFLLCVNASNAKRDFEWIQDHAPAGDCQVVDVSSQWALLALQGPKAAAILNKIEGRPDIAALRPFSFAAADMEGTECLVARTGYTGEDGFEIFVPYGHANRLARSLLEAGQSERLVLAGLGARDSLRLEAGYPLYGHELSESITPIQAGLGWTVKFDKTSDFIGRNALQKQKENGPQSKVVFFRTGARRIVRPEAEVFDGNRSVGRVLSGTLSPCLNESIGSALIESPSARSSNLTADLRGTRQKLVIVKPPFYSSTNASS